MDDLLAKTEAQLLESHLFRSKPQMQRLLQYLIKNSYENNEQALQQKSIAIECLGRTSSFVPAKDPIVRIEAARLRRLLESFYENVPQSPPYKLSLPKGSYRVCFSRNEDKVHSKGLTLLLVCQSSEYASDQVLLLMSKIRRQLSARISKFHHVELMVEYIPKNQVAQTGSVHFLAKKLYDYVLRIEVVAEKEGQCLVSSVAIHRASQEILWSDSTSVPAVNYEASLDVYYKVLVRSLVGDSCGLLGQHWSSFIRQEGLDGCPCHQISWVHLIALVSKPSLSLATAYFKFLKARLSRYPNDHIALAGYFYLGLFDFIFEYKLLDETLEERRTQLVSAVNAYPDYDTFSILLGLYSFAAGKFECAKGYLETGRQLNPYNVCWDYLYGGVLFFMGDKEEGIAIIEKGNGVSNMHRLSASYYHLPEFLYHLDQGDPSKAFQLGVKLGFDSHQWKDIGVLKSHPNLIDYCKKVVITSS